MNTAYEPSSQAGKTVSDTAHWIAGFRAEETARPDALFKDPFADRLTGGASRRAPSGVPSWPLIARTKLIDDLVLKSVGEGATLVINLAAGLDTRPYRLPLPASLRWVEADLPGIIEYKQRELASASPVCALTRESVDLGAPDQRRAFLDRTLANAERALVITEGLLVYLDAEAVDGLARDLAARSEIAWWIADISSPGVLRLMQRETDNHLAAESRMRFAPPEGVDYFRRLGFRPREVESLQRAAAKWRRAPIMLRLLTWLPEPNPAKLGQRPWGRRSVRAHRASKSRLSAREAWPSASTAAAVRVSCKTMVVLLRRGVWPYCAPLCAALALACGDDASADGGGEAGGSAGASGAAAHGGNAATAGEGGTGGKGGGSGGSSGGAASCFAKPLFNTDMAWNRSIEAAAKDAQSDRIIAALQDRGWGAGRLQIDFSLDVLCAPAGTPLRSFEPTDDFYEDECDHVPVPVPEGGHLEGEEGYACTQDGDCHLIVIAEDTLALYEQWRAHIEGDDYRGGCLAVWDLTRAYGETLRGDQCSSADAAGLPIAPLLFDADEVAAGEIAHAVRFALPNTHLRNRTYVRPATHATGAASAGDDGVPYGARLRLRADYPVASLPSEGARVLGRALQRYGMILADGGNIALMGQDDRGTHAKWDGMLGPHDMSAIAPDDFELVDAGERFTWSGDCVLGE